MGCGIGYKLPTEVRLRTAVPTSQSYQMIATWTTAQDPRLAHLRSGRDGDQPLTPTLTGFVRVYEAAALVAEGTPTGADLLLREPLPPVR